MKKILYILFIIPLIALGQVPQGVNYQAVAYDSEGFEISNQDISVRLGILLGGVDAEASYTEVHSVTTDDFGLFSLVISQGETSDTFSSINWEEGAYLKVEVDEDLDGEYSIMGVSSFNAVPYALSAPTSDEVLSKILSLENTIDSLENRVKVGDYAQGGIVFYVDEMGNHGLVAAIYDLPGTYVWGCSDIGIIGADGTEIGTGFQNTLDILNQCQDELIAARVCSDYELGDYNDWFLPSIDELNLMLFSIGQFGLNNVGQFFGEVYCSSTEYFAFNTNGYAVCINIEGVSTTCGKNYNTSIRPIRSF